MYPSAARARSMALIEDGAGEARDRRFAAVRAPAGRRRSGRRRCAGCAAPRWRARSACRRRRPPAWKVMWASMPAATGPCEFDARPKRRIGEREDRAAVAAAVEVEVPRVDRHRDLGAARAAGAKRDAERRAEAVARDQGRRAARASRIGVGRSPAAIRRDRGWRGRRPAARSAPADAGPTARCASSALEQCRRCRCGEGADDDDARLPGRRRSARDAASASRASRAPSARPAAGRPC